MKLPFKFIAGCTVAVTMLATSYGQGTGYTTSFAPADFNANASLSGQQLWDTNNFTAANPPSIPFDLGQSDFVGIVSGYSTTVNDYWALLGGATGIAPVVNTSTLFRPLDLTGATGAAFDVKFGIISSQNPRPNQDSFGWTFRDSLGNQLLRVGFIPDINQANNLTVRVWDRLDLELPGSGLFNVLYNSKYDLSVNMSSGSLVNMSITSTVPGSLPTTIINNQLDAGAVPTSIADVAATWTLADPTANPNGERPNFGSNSLVFDNYSVTPIPIPEPSTALFGLVGVVSGFVVRRRQRSA